MYNTFRIVILAKSLGTISQSNAVCCINQYLCSIISHSTLLQLIQFTTNFIHLILKKFRDFLVTFCYIIQITSGV